MSKKKRKDSRYYRMYSENNAEDNSSNSMSNISSDLKSLVNDIKDIFTDNKKISYGGHGKSFNLKKWNKKIMKKDKLHSVLWVLGVLGLLFVISRIGIPIAVVILIGLLIYIILS